MGDQIALADKESPFFSLGCDVGEHKEPMEDERATPVAGGYIDIVSRDYNARGDDHYRELIEVIEEACQLGDRLQFESVLPKA